MQAEPRRLRITPAHWAQMAAHAAAESPNEACGLLAGAEGASVQIFPITNELKSPTHYSMAPGEQLQAFMQMEQRGLQLLAIYHSHPAGPPTPSRTDLAEARYPGVVHLIWAPSEAGWGCRGFLLDGGIKEIEVELDDKAVS
ncbi:MAG: M67 family metallopeptidase [Anaerolineales bacterium]|nr:M67 family metallopeptidase [Anaerolineales bacterium]